MPIALNGFGWICKSVLEYSGTFFQFFLGIVNCNWPMKNVASELIIFPPQCLDNSFNSEIVLFFISSAVLLKILEYDSLDDSYHDKKFHNQIYKKNNKNSHSVTTNYIEIILEKILKNVEIRLSSDFKH